MNEANHISNQILYIMGFRIKIYNILNKCTKHYIHNVVLHYEVDNIKGKYKSLKY